MIPIMPIVKGLSTILGMAGAGRNASKQKNEELGILRSNADLNRRDYMLNAPGTRVKSATRASMVSQFQPSQVSMPTPGFGLRGETPTFSGGFNNPHMFADAKEVSNQAILTHLRAMLNGGDQVPEVPQIGKESAFDKILGYGSTGLGILGGLDGIFGKRPWIPHAPDPNSDMNV